MRFYMPHKGAFIMEVLFVAHLAVRLVMVTKQELVQPFHMFFLRSDLGPPESMAPPLTLLWLESAQPSEPEASGVSCIPVLLCPVFCGAFFARLARTYHLSLGAAQASSQPRQPHVRAPAYRMAFQPLRLDPGLAPAAEAPLHEIFCFFDKKL